MGDRRGEGGERMVEFVSKCKMGDMSRDSVAHFLHKLISKNKVGGGEGKSVCFCSPFALSCNEGEDFEGQLL